MWRPNGRIADLGYHYFPSDLELDLPQTQNNLAKELFKKLWRSDSCIRSERGGVWGLSKVLRQKRPFGGRLKGRMQEVTWDEAAGQDETLQPAKILIPILREMEAIERVQAKECVLESWRDIHSEKNHSSFSTDDEGGKRETRRPCGQDKRRQ